MLYKGAPPFSMSALYIIMNFNPRAPCGARQRGWSLYFVIVCFNPRAPCGARLHYRHNTTLLFCFNPRAPCGARPHFALMYAQSSTFQSTRPVWGATVAWRCTRFLTRVSIHAPRVGRDIDIPQGGEEDKMFQSTRPMRGATGKLHRHTGSNFMFQSTRPMRGATVPARHEHAQHSVSIHAPHAGRDSCVYSATDRTSAFQSTRPMRGATISSKDEPALLMFQSTRPMRGATVASSTRCAGQKFQSTRPVWGATSDDTMARRYPHVSIHALRVGRDPMRSRRR